jgi:hypothetical protein
MSFSVNLLILLVENLLYNILNYSALKVKKFKIHGFDVR